MPIRASPEIYRQIYHTYHKFIMSIILYLSYFLKLSFNILFILITLTNKIHFKTSTSFLRLKIMIKNIQIKVLFLTKIITINTIPLSSI